MRKRWVWHSSWVFGGVLLVSGLWAGEEDTQGDSARRKPAADEATHDEATCTGCAAEAVWGRFVEHLQRQGKAGLIPEGLLPQSEEAAETPEEAEAQRVAREKFQRLLQGTDPIRGVLFRLSPDMINLDEALTPFPIGTPIAQEKLPRVRELATRLAQSEDPFLAPYGVLNCARLDLQQGDFASAIDPLEKLTRSCSFLPRKDAYRLLADAYIEKGDDALAVLSLQFLKLECGAIDTGGVTWADEELKKIRDRKFAGPLDNSESSMRSIEKLILEREVGAHTQTRQERVEGIIDRVVKLLERQGGG